MDIVHRIVNGETSINLAAGRIDIKGNIFTGIFRLEKQQLGTNQARHLAVNGACYKDNAILEQTGKYVVGALTTRGLLNDHRDKRIHGRHRWSLRVRDRIKGYVMREDFLSLDAAFDEASLSNS